MPAPYDPYARRFRSCETLSYIEPYDIGLGPDATKILFGDGVWRAAGGVGIAHNLLSVTHPDTLAGVPVRGDIIIANPTPSWSALAFAANSVLISDATDVKWATTLPTVVQNNITRLAALVETLDLTNAAAGQIAFPATQHASTNANTLDDYGEGGWTPVDASGAGLIFTAVGTAYMKIGRLVFARFELTYPATADGANARIGGLPFSVSSYAPLSVYTNYAAGHLGAIFLSGTTGINLFELVGGGNVTNAALSGKIIHGAGCYIATV